ncbi:hypothetical protein RUND412_005672 [Rhizina undulata]
MPRRRREPDFQQPQPPPPPPQHQYYLPLQIQGPPLIHTQNLQSGIPPQVAPAPPLMPARAEAPQIPNAGSPEAQRLLHVLETLKPMGFTSISDFLVKLFTSEDAAVRRRVSLFYTHGGIRSLLEIFMNSKRARENGGDEVAVSWAGGVFKEEFDAGLVKGGINVDVRANSTESRGRTTGEILREGLETFDLAKVQKQCEKKSPLLWRLLETLSSSDRERNEPKAAASPENGNSAPNPVQPPVAKRRKTDPGPSSTGALSGLPSNPPLTVVILLLLLASSQVRNKFQKWLGLYLYAQGVRKGPLNSLRTLGVGSEGKVIGDNVLRVIGDDTKKKLRAELGGLDLSVRGPGAPRVNSRASKRKSLGNAAGEASATNSSALGGPNPLDGKRPFVISQITYHPSPKDHLRADNFAPCATIPFIIRLPKNTPVLTKSMVKTSAAFRREKYITTGSMANMGNVVREASTSVSNNQGAATNNQTAAGAAVPAGGYPYYGYSFNSSAFNTTPGYDAPTPAPNGDYYYAPPTPGINSGPTWPGNAAAGVPGASNGDLNEDGLKFLLMDEDGNLFWKNRARKGIWRAMKRLWPKIQEFVNEDDVVEEQVSSTAGNTGGNRAEEVNGEEGSHTPLADISGVAEDDLIPLPSLKRVNPQKVTEQMSVLEVVTDYLGFETKHLKGSSQNPDRLWLWAGNLETLYNLKASKAYAAGDSILHNVLPVLQLFDIRQLFLLELLKQHYGKPNDKDPTSLCHHMQIMNRKFLIFGFSVTGQYAEGLLLHSLESHLITSILTTTKIRESGPKTREEILSLIDQVYKTYLDPELVKTHQSQPAHERDEVFENHMLFMQHSLVYTALLESINSGSVTGLLHVLTWLATAFQTFSTQPSTKMARELLELVVGLKYEWAPPLRVAVLQSMLISKPPGTPFPVLAGHPASAKVNVGSTGPQWHELDFAMKQILRQTKTVFDLRDNPKHDFFREVATPNIRTISLVVKNAEESLGTAPRTANQWKSPAENVDPDREIPKLVQELQKEKVGVVVKGRKASVPVEHLIAKGEEAVRSPGFVEDFVKRGDLGGEGAAVVIEDVDAALGGVAPSSVAPTGKEKEKEKGVPEWRRRNLFFAEDFAFDWGL